MKYLVKERVVRVVMDDGFFHDEHLESRFDICDEKGNVIDDAQGHGYKTEQKAHRAAYYKFKGGKEKIEEAVAFWKANPVFAKQMSDFLLANFKEKLSDADVLSFAHSCGFENFNPKWNRQLR